MFAAFMHAGDSHSLSLSFKFVHWPLVLVMSFLQDRLSLVGGLEEICLTFVLFVSYWTFIGFLVALVYCLLRRGRQESGSSDAV